jgi:hypothetical protein
LIDYLNQTLAYKTPTLSTFFELIITNVTGFCVYYPVYQNYSANTDLLDAAVAVCFKASTALTEALEDIQDHVSHARVVDSLGTVGYESNGSDPAGYNETLSFEVMNSTWTISCHETYAPQP